MRIDRILQGKHTIAAVAIGTKSRDAICKNLSSLQSEIRKRGVIPVPDDAEILRFTIMLVHEYCALASVSKGKTIHAAGFSDFVAEEIAAQLGKAKAKAYKESYFVAACWALNLRVSRRSGVYFIIASGATALCAEDKPSEIQCASSYTSQLLRDKDSPEGILDLAFFIKKSKLSKSKSDKSRQQHGLDYLKKMKARKALTLVILKHIEASRNGGTGRNISKSAVASYFNILMAELEKLVAIAEAMGKKMVFTGGSRASSERDTFVLYADAKTALDDLVKIYKKSHNQTLNAAIVDYHKIARVESAEDSIFKTKTRERAKKRKIAPSVRPVVIKDSADIKL
jgi:hypothetical protein